MLPQTDRPALICAALCACAVITGCQTYQPRPLDAEASRAAFLARTPSDATVAEFAQRLGSVDPDPISGLDPSDGLNMREGEIVALVYNPELRLARLEAGVARATADHAGMWDDPEFSLDLMRITSSVPDPWIVGPSLAITIPISGRLAVEQARADSAYRAELARVAEQEWHIRHELRTAWLEWSALRLRQHEHAALIESVASLSRTASRLAEAGEMLSTESALFSMEHAHRRYTIAQLTRETEQAELRLRSIMGLSPGAPLTLRAASIMPVRTEYGATIPANNPTLRRLEIEYEAAEHTLHREIKKQYPDITIGPAYESEQGQSRVGIAGAIPIPILNANKQGIAEAYAKRELARAAYETEQERLISRAAAARRRVEGLTHELSQYTSDLAPLADRQLDESRRLLELGEGSGLVLLESLVRASDIKLGLIGANLELAIAHEQLRYLLGPTSTNEVTP